MERKIDLVYLWLDGNDKNWRREKDKWQAVESGKVKLAEEGTVEARWRENDELKYSLRSVAKFAPWINHIYIVTCMGQTPSWLDTSNPKITIIDHSQIMPADGIPNFNATAIENCIVNIPGLSEYFLYANDDMFFGRPIEPDYFFDKEGHVIVWHTKDKNLKKYVNALKNASSDYVRMLCFASKLFHNLFDKDYIKIRPSHNIEAYRKSSIKELLSNPLIDMYFQKTIRRKFRNKFDIHRWIFTLYDIAFNNAVTHRIRTKRRKHHFIYNFINKINGKFKDSPIYTTNAMVKGILNIHPALFCINDTIRRTSNDDTDNEIFLKKYFPDRCEFEK